MSVVDVVMTNPLKLENKLQNAKIRKKIIAIKTIVTLSYLQVMAAEELDT